MSDDGDGKKDNVVFLNFRSPHMVEGNIALLACGYCKNKTYTLTYDSQEDFPMMKCAACGQHVGRMGWSHDDPEGE